MIDYFMQHMWQLWALISLICLIMELTMGDFFIMCFAIGGVCSAIASAIGINGVGQIIVFAIFTIISLLLVRPTALKYLHRGEENRISNADAIIGRTGIVSETIIKGGYGRVAIDGDDWKAQSTETENVEKGEKVIVESRDSIIITVKRA
ncbi:MAG: NfeD family protein [Prevotella sp.]|nr:NfeD family protein [Prevotella sp.]